MEHVIPTWMLIPFVVQLLCIAILPLTKLGEWWENNTHKLIVSLILGVPVGVYLCLNGMSHELEHQMIYDYVPFILLLMALFVTTGGICIKGDLKYGAPRSNPDGSISLHARRVAFEHPVSHQPISIEAPYPESQPLWQLMQPLDH